MKLIYYLAIIFITYNSNLYAQPHKVDAAFFEKLHLRRHQYLEDSETVISEAAPLEVKAFTIKFTVVKFNKKDSLLELAGKIYERSEKYGLPGTDIFKAIRVGDSLMDRRRITLSDYDEEDSNKNGFFKLTMKVKPDDRLYFRFSFYYLEEFLVGKLLE